MPEVVGHQPELFPRSKRPTVPIDENHRLVQLGDRLDWTEMEVRAEEMRASKLKNAAGRPPKLRALLGAMVLRATRYEPYRVLEDLIRHYAGSVPVRPDGEEWTPDHNTLHDFMELMGEEGVRFINEYAVEWAVEEKLADPKVLVADTTAQEAATPYPNEHRHLRARHRRGRRLTSSVVATAHEHRVTGAGQLLGCRAPDAGVGSRDKADPSAVSMVSMVSAVSMRREAHMTHERRRQEPPWRR